MARYIKANPLVAEYLQLKNDRNTVSDGNYLLWQNDMLKFGPLTQLSNTLEKIGGISLMPHEARQEQDGTVVRALPTATDSRFKVQTTTTAGNDNASDSEVETEQSADSTDGTSETETEAETETTTNEQEA